MKTRLALMMPLFVIGLAAALASPHPDYPVVTPGTEFRFPRDHGAHPAYRTEWWYFTGWLDAPDGRPIGFQITFFRSRPAIDAPDATGPSAAIQKATGTANFKLVCRRRGSCAARVNGCGRRRRRSRLDGVLAAKQILADRIIAMSRYKCRQDLALEYGATEIVSGGHRRSSQR